MKHLLLLILLISSSAFSKALPVISDSLKNRVETEFGKGNVEYFQKRLSSGKSFEYRLGYEGHGFEGEDSLYLFLVREFKRGYNGRRSIETNIKEKDKLLFKNQKQILLLLAKNSNYKINSNVSLVSPAFASLAVDSIELMEHFSSERVNWPKMTYRDENGLIAYQFNNSALSPSLNFVKYLLKKGVDMMDGGGCTKYSELYNIICHDFLGGNPEARSCKVVNYMDSLGYDDKCDYLDF